MASLNKVLDRVAAVAAQGFAAVGALCTVAMMIVVASDVVMRYVFNNPSMWSDEIASYLLIGIVFLGLAQNLRQDGHIRIDIVVGLSSARTRLVLELIAYALGLVFSVVLIAGTWTRFDNFWSRHITSDSPLMTPLWIPMAPVVVSAVLLCFAMLTGFISNLHTVVSGRGRGPTA